MGVDAAPADDVAAGRREGDAAEARQHRAGQQDRGADPGAERGIERLGLDALGVDAHGVGPDPLDRRRRGARGARAWSPRPGCGARCRVRTGPSASSVAARIGRAAFLLPAGRMVPLRARPPRTLYRSGMGEQYQRVPRRQAQLALAIGRPVSMFSHAASSAGHAGLGRADHGDLARHHCLRLRHHRLRGRRPWPRRLHDSSRICAARWPGCRTTCSAR